MRNSVLFRLFLALLVTTSMAEPTVVNCNPNSDGEPWYALSEEPAMSARDSLFVATAQTLELSPRRSRSARRTYVDNSQLRHFRSIFMQKGNVCAQASGISYALTYELNLARGLDADSDETTYPYFFTYNQIEGDGKVGSWYWEGFDIAQKLGVPNSKMHGGFDVGNEYRWVSGYDIYYNAAQNRASDFYKIDVTNADGVEALKQWFDNHGNGSAEGGIAVFSANVMQLQQKTITHSSSDVTTMVTKWGNYGFHAMTFAGYDDTIPYMDLNYDGEIKNEDVNGNGVIDPSEMERGAWLVVNSYGSGWGSNGRAWYPYHSAGTLTHGNSGNYGGIHNTGVWVVSAKEDRDPEYMLKVTMTSTDRSTLKIRAGVAASHAATEPTVSKDFGYAFNYSGYSYPMQGNYGASATLEAGFDITELMEEIGYPSQAKVFLIVEDSSQSVTSTINSFTLMDYTQSPLGEIASTQSNVSTSKGTQYLTIDYTVPEDMIYLTAPSKGALFDRGDTVNIVWRGSEPSAVSVSLKQGTTVVSLADSETNDGTFSWIIPSDIAYGSDYAIIVTDASNTSNADTSDLFSIDVCYSLRVENGSNSGNYVENAKVSISADLGLGWVFDKWVGDVEYLTDEYSPSTGVTIPAKDIVVTATYKSKPDISKIDQSSISIYDKSSQYGTARLAEYAIDNDESTFWHSDWANAPTLPQYLTFKLDKEYEIAGFDYLPRQDGSENGFIKGYRIELSDDGVNWTVVTTGELENKKEKSEIFFQAQSASYVKFTATSDFKEQKWAGISEFNLYFDDKGGATSVAKNSHSLVKPVLVYAKEKQLHLTGFSDGTARVTAYRLNGQELFSKEVQILSGSAGIDMRSMPKGVVILRINTNTISVVRKVAF